MKKLGISIAPVILATMLLVSYGTASLTSSAVLATTGQISTKNVYATSGKATDIQAAVNIAASAGGGTVHIPAGSWLFNSQSSAWQTVTIPYNVNITGILNQTILYINYDVPTAYNPDSPEVWFSYVGNEGNTAFRFSNMTLIGPRYWNQSNIDMFQGLFINDALNFRVDHCIFQDMCGSAIWAGSNDYTGTYINTTSSGVIDHNVINNTYGYGGGMTYTDRTLDYGVGLRIWPNNVWVPTSSVWGQYTNHTVFIENCYFSKWRHCVCSNDGYHYVFRYNVVDKDYAEGSVDGHGSYATSPFDNAVGTRCMEVYNNTFQYPDYTWADAEWSGNTWAIDVRGGSGIVTNNTFINYTGVMMMVNDDGNFAPYSPECFVNQTYIWNNTLNGANVIANAGDSVLNVNYFLRAPTMAQDGITYTPYQYPSPLTR